MCTVSFLPLENSGFILTSSRDEAYARPLAEFPFRNQIGNHNEVVYPLDPQGNGSWIASSVKSTVCLLNGGFVKHKHHPPYRHSRGLVVTGYFEFDTAIEFAENFDLQGIEPFTLLMIEHENDLNFSELVWDGAEKHIRNISTESPEIWSSSTLYTVEVVKERKMWFRKWTSEQSKFEAEQIREFHHFGGNGDESNSIRMKRGDFLGSLSITSIVKDNGHQGILYEDLASSTISKYDISNRRAVISKKNENA